MKPVLTVLTPLILVAAFAVTAIPAEAEQPSGPAVAAEAALDLALGRGPLRDDLLVFDGAKQELAEVEYHIVRERRGDEVVGYRAYIGAKAGPDRPFMVMRQRRAAGADETWQIVFGDSTMPLFTIKLRMLDGEVPLAHVAYGRTVRAGRTLYTVRDRHVFHGQGRGDAFLELEMPGARESRVTFGDAWLCRAAQACDEPVLTVRGAELDEHGLLPLLTVLAESELGD